MRDQLLKAGCALRYLEKLNLGQLQELQRVDKVKAKVAELIRMEVADPTSEHSASRGLLHERELMFAEDHRAHANCRLRLNETKYDLSEHFGAVSVLRKEPQQLRPWTLSPYNFWWGLLYCENRCIVGCQSGLAKDLGLLASVPWVPAG